jgi:hypothetical protein
MQFLKSSAGMKRKRPLDGLGSLLRRIKMEERARIKLVPGLKPVASMREEYGHAHALQHVTGNTTQDHLT